MGWKIRDDYVDQDRRDPTTGVAPAKGVSLGRVVAQVGDDVRMGDERIFMAGALVPDNYVPQTMIDLFDAGDEHVSSFLEQYSGSSDSPYKGLDTAVLDELIATRGITIEKGSGAGGNVVKKDKIAALDEHDKTQPAGDPLAVTVNPPAPVTGDNPFAVSS
jgi:hypothetical protein